MRSWVVVVKGEKDKRSRESRLHRSTRRPVTHRATAVPLSLAQRLPTPSGDVVLNLYRSGIRTLLRKFGGMLVLLVAMVILVIGTLRLFLRVTPTAPVIVPTVFYAGAVCVLGGAAIAMARSPRAAGSSLKLLVSPPTQPY